MIDTEFIAAIDTDFLNNLANTRDNDDIIDLIARFFKALNVEVIMHPLVYEHEKSPVPNLIIEELINEGIIVIPTLSEIFEGKPGGKQYYELMVMQMYRDFTGQKYPVDDVCGKWKKQCNLGEIH